MAEVSTANRWEVLTRTGPGTLGGELLRRYWQPVALSEELAPGSPPRPIRILGEDLVLFRDEAGRVGLLGLKCPHRNADLSYGRIEQGGLRCVYHGWVFDVTGQCLDQPNVPVDQRNALRIRHKAYPCVERGGLAWSYMGPGEPPAFPNYPFLDAPPEHRYAMRWYSACNYMQGNEGDIDPSHTSFLHRIEVKTEEEAKRYAAMSGFRADGAPKLTVYDTSYGFRILSERRLDAQGTRMLRASSFIMPNAASANGVESAYGLGGCSIMWHVPIDDVSHQRFEVYFHAKTRLPIAKLEEERRHEQPEMGLGKRNASNRYLQDRSEMAAKTYLGMGGVFPVHDLFITESMGSVTDHSTEHLVASDIGVVSARRMMLKAIEQIERGEDPRGVVRGNGANFADFVIFTAKIDPGVEPAAFVEELVQRKIYTMDTGGAEGRTPEMA